MVEQVKCPRCGRRLFDKERGSKGAIVIKCSHCRKHKLKLEQLREKVHDRYTEQRSQLNC